MFLNPLLGLKLKHIWHLLEPPSVLMPLALRVWIWVYSIILFCKSTSVSFGGNVSGHPFPGLFREVNLGSNQGLTGLPRTFIEL